MSIDSETVVGFGVIVDFDKFFRGLGLDNAAMEEIFSYFDLTEAVANLADVYGSKLGFHYNYTINTVFISTAGTQTARDGDIIEIDLEKMYDGAEELKQFLGKHFKKAGVPRLVTCSYTT